MWLFSHLALWALVLSLGFLLVGSLLALGRLAWRVEQLEATTPARLGRGGLRLGSEAPDFTRPAVAGGDVSLSDLTGPVFLVFLQVGCKPCRRIVPALNRLQRSGQLQVLAVSNGEPEKVRDWARDAGACFPVLVQQDHLLSRRYQVFATPFAFLVDERRRIAGKGLITKDVHISFLLAGSRLEARDARGRDERVSAGMALS